MVSVIFVIIFKKLEEYKMSDSHLTAFDKASKAGFIIALGIVYGDIGTSPFIRCSL